VTGLEVISAAGLLAGSLDLSATSILVRTQGVPLERLLQTIASGLYGPTAFQRGKRAAVIGLLLHFFIALAAAAVYYAASRKLLILNINPLLYGPLYGIAVHLVMSCIVIPLSSVPKRKFSAKALFSQLVIHIVCVGLPIALTVSHLSR
jgi:uncharacterized membrane protein YagU involved in acid resistance